MYSGIVYIVNKNRQPESWSRTSTLNHPIPLFIASNKYPKIDIIPPRRGKRMSEANELGVYLLSGGFAPKPLFRPSPKVEKNNT